ncbi:MAG: transposase family protein, partial [Acidiferrobacter sp.]
FLTGIYASKKQTATTLQPVDYSPVFLVRTRAGPTARMDGFLGSWVIYATRRQAPGLRDRIPHQDHEALAEWSCGAVVKKPLSKRWHECSCGVCAQRDLYSAYLALHVRVLTHKDSETWMLDTESAREDGCAVEPLLEKAVSGVVQAANGGPLPASFGLSQKPARDRVALSRKGAGTKEDFGCCSPVA